MIPNADLLKKHRLDRAWSQDHLAMVAGVSLRTVQRAEKGEACSFETIRALAGAFDLTVAEINHSEAASKDGRSVKANKSWGFWGVTAGFISSYAAITMSVVFGHATLAESGVYYGLFACLAGVSYLAVNYLSTKL